MTVKRGSGIGKKLTSRLGVFVLCEETDEDIARYSILHGNEQLFASKYKLYLPDEEELRREISRQNTIFAKVSQTDGLIQSNLKVICPLVKNFEEYLTTIQLFNGYNPAMIDSQKLLNLI